MHLLLLLPLLLLLFVSLPWLLRLPLVVHALWVAACI
jgi:hypothetical protein